MMSEYAFFQKFPGGECPQTPLLTMCLWHMDKPSPPKISLFTYLPPLPQSSKCNPDDTNHNSQQVKLPTSANKEAPCPSSLTKQGQISCADFGQSVFTNSLHSSPTETTAHSCQPTAHIHNPTQSLHSYVPFAIQKHQ